MGYFDHKKYVELTMHFRCNFKCEHCMIEDTMDRLRPLSLDDLQKVLDHNASTNKWDGLILTGSEITLRKDLPELARLARQHHFDHVRIQTHGMRLANADYCRELIQAGVDEYFVSITAADAASHDAITKVPGSFERTMQGLEHLDAFEHVSILTNTVITQRSFRQLPAIVDRLRHLRRLVQMDFWTYWPMSEADEKDLVARHTDVVPYLRRAIALARAQGRAVEVKNFPECLLAEDGDALDNTQPELYIDPNFWREFDRNGFKQCVHREACGSTQCLGLNTAYVKKYGWQKDLLTPLRRCPIFSGRVETRR